MMETHREHPPCVARARGARRYTVPAAEPEVVAAALDAAMDGGGGARGGRGGIVRSGGMVARHCRRGGLVRFLLRDRYLGNRPRREFEIHRRAWAAGLPVPEPLGVCWERRGLFCRGALATRALDAVELLDALREDPGRAADFLAAGGRAVRRMHEAGIWHADLQARNVLVNGDTAYLIDFDRGRRLPAPGRHCWRAMNLYRFRRSLEKHGFPAAYFRHFCAGYGGPPGCVVLGGWYRFRSAVLRLLTTRK